MEGSDFLISLKFNRHFLGFRMIIGKKGENELKSIITCNAQLVARNLQRVTRIPHPATRILPPAMLPIAAMKHMHNFQ